MLPFEIIGSASLPPGHKLSSSSLDAKLALPQGTVAARSGVNNRYFAFDTELQSQVAAANIIAACENAQISTSDLDMVISASAVQEQILPSTYTRVLQALNLHGKSGMDVNNSCLSFMSALQVAAAILNGSHMQYIAIVAVEFASRGLDWKSPEASYIFGDGAAAFILKKNNIANTGIICTKTATYPDGVAFCEITGGGTLHPGSSKHHPQQYLFKMDGKRVFKLASQHLPQFLDTFYQECQALAVFKPDYVVPHQASHLAMEHLQRKLFPPKENNPKIINIYPDYGNQVAASLPTALHIAMQQESLAHKQVLLLGTAAGLTLGAMALQF